MTTATRRKLQESFAAYAFLAPAAIILGTFWLLPTFFSFAISFGNLTALAPADTFRFVGFSQYQRALYDERFQQSLWNTVNYALYSVPLTLALSLGAAMLLNTKIKGRGFWRTVFFLPYVTTWVAISIVWTYIFHRDHGLANALLAGFSQGMLGLERPWSLNWLQESRGIWEMIFGFNASRSLGWLPGGLEHLFAGPSLAMSAIIITSVWRNIGYFMVIFLAGLQNIDKTYYEAANIDGASEWRQFVSITFPLLSPVTFLLLIIAMIDAFKVFTPMLIMAPTGGPNNTASPIVFYIYDVGFRNTWQLSYAAAIAYILTLLILVLSLVQNRFFGRKVVYQ